MKIWIIWIYPVGGVRFMDSMWADSDHAQARVDELQASWKAAGNPASGVRHQTWVQSGMVADASLSAGPTAPAPTEPSADARETEGSSHD